MSCYEYELLVLDAVGIVCVLRSIARHLVNVCLISCHEYGFVCIICVPGGDARHYVNVCMLIVMLWVCYLCFKCAPEEDLCLAMYVVTCYHAFFTCFMCAYHHPMSYLLFYVLHELCVHVFVSVFMYLWWLATSGVTLRHWILFSVCTLDFVDLLYVCSISVELLTALKTGFFG
jgi:hypothetical protein